MFHNILNNIIYHILTFYIHNTKINYYSINTEKYMNDPYKSTVECRYIISCFENTKTSTYMCQRVFARYIQIYIYVYVYVYWCKFLVCPSFSLPLSIFLSYFSPSPLFSQLFYSMPSPLQPQPF